MKPNGPETVESVESGSAASDLLDHALGVAGIGMKVFPVHGVVTPGANEALARCGCGRAGCESPGKHPMSQGWQDAATAGHVRIREWFGNGAALNYGIVLGGYWTVVEVDPYHGGSLRALRDVVGDLGPISVSGRGFHVFFRESNVPNGTTLGPGMTARSDGYFVVGPGSTHYTGRRYGRRRYGWDEMLDRPPLVVDRTTHASGNASRFVGAPPTVATRLPERIHDGEQRWRHLLSLAGTLRRRGLSEAELVEQLDVFNRNRCRPPKADADVRRIAAWVVAHDTTIGLDEAAPPSIEAFEPAEGLAELRSTFTRWLLLPDTAVLDVSMAAIAYHRMAGEPVWPLLVSPPSGGKTEVIRALSGAPEVYELSSLTAQTLVSGMGKAKSLLPRLDDMGKSFLTLKDFTTVLTLHTDARAEILAQLRELYDGSFRKEFGTGEGVAWEGRLGFLAGVTPAIDTHHAATAVLGERFAYLRLAQPPRKVLANRILDERPSETEMRAELRAAVARFLAGLTLGEPPALDEDTKRWLIGVGDLVSYARSAVQRDGYTREILVVPEPEANPRLLKQLAGLYRALLAIGCTQPEAKRIVEKVARDSAPVARIAVLQALAERDTLSTSDLANAVALPTNTAGRIVEDLVALRLVQRVDQGKGKAHLYLLTPLGAEMWVETGWL